MAVEILVRAIEAGRPRGPVKPERSLSASEIWGAPLPGLASPAPPDAHGTTPREATGDTAMDL
jgi:hypothetical protein